MFKTNLKKNFAIALALATLPINTVFAQSTEIQCIPTVEGKKVTCSVTLPEVKGNGAVIMITAKGDADIQAADVYAMDLITETNPQPLIFVMPDSATGDINEQYSVIIRNGNETEKTFDFYYVNPDIAEDVMSALRATVQADIETFLSGATDGVANTAGLAAMGVKTDILNSITTNRTLVWDLYYAKASEFAGMTDNELITHMNDSIISGALNETDANVATLMIELNKSFGGTEYKKMPIAQQHWINQYVTSNLPVSITKSAADIFETGNILYAFNKARYSDIDALVTKYGSKVGIAASTYYTVYQGFDSARKITAQEKIVTSLSSSPVNATTSLVSVFETAVAAANVVVQHQGGGSVSGGSSSSGGGGLAVNSTTEIVNPAKPFDDLTSVGWAEEAILALNKRNVIAGMGDKKFCPQEKVTREQMVKMILLAAGFSALDVKTNFTDVKPGAWYAPYVGHAVEKGIAVGMDDVTFGVGRNITRQDAAVMIDRAMKKISKNKQAIREYVPFSDETAIAPYAIESVKQLYVSGVVNGKGQQNFAPADTCTRAEAAKMIYDAFIK